MRTVSIFVEGGGNGKNTAQNKADLRNGMNTFLGELKDAAEAKKWTWELRFCGDGSKTCKAFKNERNFDNGSKIIVLLVDSEEPVTSPTVIEHLRTRQECKLDLAGVPADHVHLMVQTMETWIVADRAALSDYYDQGFRTNELPSRQNLEEENKKKQLQMPSIKRQNERRRAATKRFGMPPIFSRRSIQKRCGGDADIANACLSSSVRPLRTGNVVPAL